MGIGQFWRLWLEVLVSPLVDHDLKRTFCEEAHVRYKGGAMSAKGMGGVTRGHPCSSAYQVAENQPV